MKTIHERKLTKIFPNTTLSVIVSDRMAKNTRSFNIEEVKDKNSLYSIHDYVEITITVDDGGEGTSDYITRVYPQLEMSGNEDYFANRHPQLFVQPEPEGSWFLSKQARNGDELVVVGSYDLATTHYLYMDADGQELEIPLVTIEEKAM